MRRASCPRIQAGHLLVEVIFLGVTSTLVQEADVLAARLTRQRDAALIRHHLLGRVRVDAAGEATLAAGAAAEGGQDVILRGGEASLEGPVDVLADREGDRGPLVGASRHRRADVPQQRAGAWRIGARC